jgi:hypothetical protein
MTGFSLHDSNKGYLVVKQKFLRALFSFRQELNPFIIISKYKLPGIFYTAITNIRINHQNYAAFAPCMVNSSRVFDSSCS